MTDDDQLLYKRLIELSNRAYQNNIYTFSDFLSLSQQDVLFQAARDKSFAPIKFDLFGGYENCERKMVRFGSEDDLGYIVDFPIKCIKIEPLAKKFAKEYTHRDYLGSLMSLGIDRKKFGDIFVDGMDAYMYADESTADYLLENFVSVGRNSVKCSYSELPEEYKKAALKEITIQVASPRADAVIAKVYNLSRKDTIPYFTEKKVSVNGHIVENNDKMLAAGDTVSVRGFGKFNLLSEGGLSRKGKLNLTVEVFGR
ncbi:YlmH family RNA-binding protein [Pseudobutyrivibrio sp. MD2005]|uniref:YlmH family RNA-binding protein n=1 Tax=Pseudobutyrivibrio sp. MD2005 TaxID=1410616 RepID=UPI000487E630|nr:YlmH/Sll1252 family protein [Pseudobutyrivibrio sp. MD2005]